MASTRNTTQTARGKDVVSDTVAEKHCAKREDDGADKQQHAPAASSRKETSVLFASPPSGGS